MQLWHHIQPTTVGVFRLNVSLLAVCISRKDLGHKNASSMEACALFIKANSMCFMPKPSLNWCHTGLNVDPSTYKGSTSATSNNTTQKPVLQHVETTVWLFEAKTQQETSPGNWGGLEPSRGLGCVTYTRNLELFVFSSEITGYDFKRTHIWLHVSFSEI